MSRAIGSEGERRAEKCLRDKGLLILERNYSTRRGEIDLVAMDGDILVFVEVKSRAADGFGLPQETVGARKRQRLVKAAQAYLLQRGWEGPARFDVVAILNGVFTHIEDAFPAA